MKRIINALGYFTLLLIPFIIFIFKFGLHTPVKIISVIGLIIIIILQILHFKKTMIKYIGIRILTTILIIVLITIITVYAYGFIKNLEAQKLWNSVEKIEMRDYTLEKEDLEDVKIEFVKDNFIMSKGSEQALIYFNDGSVETMKILWTSADIFEIKGNNYYLRNLPIY